MTNGFPIPGSVICAGMVNPQLEPPFASYCTVSHISHSMHESKPIVPIVPSFQWKLSKPPEAFGMVVLLKNGGRETGLS